MLKIAGILDVFQDFYKQKLGQKSGHFAKRESLEVPNLLSKTKNAPMGVKKRNDPWTEVLSNLSAKGHFCSLLVSNIIGYLAFLGSDV